MKINFNPLLNNVFLYVLVLILSGSSFAQNAPQAAATHASTVPVPARSINQPASVAPQPTPAVAPVTQPTPAAGAAAAGLPMNTAVNANATNTPPQDMAVGRVAWVTGTMTGQLPNEPVRPLKRASLIYLHDTLATGDNSEGEIVYTDNSLTSFRPDTTVHVDNYQFDAKQPAASTGEQAQSLIKGGLRTVTGWIGKTHPQNYQMNTPVGTIGVRGTDYSIYYDALNGLLVSLNYGKIYVASRGGKLELNKDANEIYGQIKAKDLAPTLLSSRPAIFKNDVKVIPARISSTPLPTPANLKAAAAGMLTTLPKSTGGANTTNLPPERNENMGGGGGNCSNDLDISIGGNGI